MEDSASTRDIKAIEADFAKALKAQPLDITALIAELDEAHAVKAYNADKMANTLQEKLVEAKDIDGLIAVLSKRAEWNGDQPTLGQSMPQIFKALSADRNFIRMVDCVKFGKVKATESLRRLALLRKMAAGDTYFDKTWGLGEIKGIDFFDSRVAIDFHGKPGHSMSLEYAAEALRPVSADHILAFRHRDPEGFAKALKEEPGKLIRAALASFGPSSIGRLQTLFATYDIVSEDGWRSFWSKARSDLGKHKDIVVPAKRSDPLYLCEGGSGRAYDDAWFDRLQKIRNIPEIFDAVSDYEKAAGKAQRSEKASKILSDRLSFAIKGAFLFPPPMFTRLVLLAQRLGVETSNEQLAEMLLDDDRFMMAGDKLPVGEAKEMIQFIASTKPEAVGILFDRIPEMGYTLLKQMMATFWNKPKAVKKEEAAAPAEATPAAEAAPAETAEAAPAAEAPAEPAIDKALLTALQDRVRDLLSSPSAPYTLVVWTLRENKWEDLKSWRLPSLYELLDHAIAICEDQAAAGEALQMQHIIRDLFVGDYVRQDKAKREKSKKAKKAEADEAQEGEATESKATESKTKKRTNTWFANIFRQLNKDPLQQEALFMRLQSNAAIAEPRFQRMLAETMVEINPALEAKRVSTFDATPEQVQQHYTSWHSLKNRQEEFRRLVEEEIPKNTKDISYARSLGDLRENSEYQYAKDQQRILLARREAWSVELEQMHGTDFAEFSPDFTTVEMATTVTVTRADGTSATYAILGEWDNDDALHILPSGSRLAQLLKGHKVGDKVAIPTGVGEEEVTVTAIAPLSAAVREWIGKPAE